LTNRRRWFASAAWIEGKNKGRLKVIEEKRRGNEMNVHDLIIRGTANDLMGIILLYAGPDQIIPLISIIGAIVGFLLIWWQRFVALVKKAWRLAGARIHSNKRLHTSPKIRP
jgi:hypothetical protein